MIGLSYSSSVNIKEVKAMPTNRGRRFREQADVYFPGAVGALLVQLR